MNNIGLCRVLAPIVFFVLMLGSTIRSFGQTDTEFWFVVPEITWAHNFPGGVPANFRLSTMAFPATVTISMPANQYHPTLNPGGFKDIVVNMLPNTTQSVNMAPFVRKVPAVAGEAGEANVIENKTYTPSGINNVGLHITSTNVITAYYEVGNLNNSDIWALKGKNALGTNFYATFQNQTPNVVHNPPAYSAIDIVATEDNTTISITPPINAAYGQLNTVIPAGSTYTITLNRGQTFSVFPAGKGVAAAAHIGGTRITSNKKIAISLKDDSINHTSGGCYDVVGDQIVPTDIIGWDYIAIRSQLNVKDHIYITATVNGTNVTVRYGAIVLSYVLNAGQQQYVPFPNTHEIMRITSDATHPVYVFHIGGFGCEQGGAILPPINICTGSTQVAFTRANTQSFFINLMVRAGAESSFELDGSAAAAAALFPAASFQNAPGLPATQWKAARFGPFTTAQIAQTQHLLRNTEDLFHLGIVNGGASSGCMYGYFSDYNELKVDAVVAGTGSSVLKTCYGVPVQLFASGGTNFKWTPGTSLSNDTIFNPFANPEVTTMYSVVVEGACDMKDTAFITVAVSTKLEANFSTDKVVGCAPLTVDFKDNSTGVAYWKWDFGDSTAYQIYDTNIPDLTYTTPPASGIVSHTFQNNSADTNVYHVQLLAKNGDQCSSVYDKYITVYPSMNAAFTATPTTGCNPLPVSFTNNSTTNTVDAYLWDYGDGVTQNMATTGPVAHTYNNTILPATNVTYPMRLIATSPFGCKDTATQNITVSAYIKADFDIDKVAGCSPLSVGFTDKAVGQINSWTLSNFGSGPQPASPTTAGDYTLTYNNVNAISTSDIVSNLTLTITNNDGCPSTITKPVTAYAEVHAGIPLPAASTFCSPFNVQFGSTTTTTPVSYSWTFGDGGTYSLDNPLHLYTNITNALLTPTASLVLTTPRGCKDSVTRNLTIYSLVKADFSVDTPKYCSPFRIMIDNNSRGGIVSYLWDYDDGTPTTNGSSDHSHTYNNAPPSLVPITPNLSLTVTNEGGCTSSLVRPITVYPEVHADFNMDQSVGCNPLLVDFTYTGNATASVFNWSFGDSGSSVDSDPIHEYINDTGKDTTYTAKVLALSAFGCKDSIDFPVTVYAKVDANFSIDKTFGCSPLGVDVDNKLWSGNSFYNWDWDGGGTTDSTTNLVTSKFRHIYTNTTGVVQSIPLTLTVANTHPQCTDKMVRFIQVYPEVDAIYTPLNQTGCTPFNLTFNNASVLTGSANKPDYYYWSFGDGGNSRLVSPPHQFLNSSDTKDTTYNMKLVAETVFGCKDSLLTNITVHPRLKADFVIDSASRCTPFSLPITPSAIGATTYTWVFGDGTPNGNFAGPGSFTHQYDNPDPNNLVTYNLKLNVTNSGGACRDSLTRTVRVYPRVFAKFVPDKDRGCNPLTVNFTNQSTGNARFVWEFGNGASSVVNNPTVIFSHPDRNDSQTYKVTLKTTNERGCESLKDTSITVYPLVEADFTIDKNGGCSPLTMSLNNLTQSPAYSYTWRVNSGAPFSVVASPPTLTLTNPTNTPPQLQVDTLKFQTYFTGDATCAATIKKVINVYPRVYPDFNLNSAGCQPHTVNFLNNTRSYNGTATYKWDFGNLVSTLDPNPSQTYFNNSYTVDKSYVATLVSTSEHGCVDSVKKTVTVYPKPFAGFKFISPSVACAPFNFELQNISKGTGLTYTYDFGDGTPDLITGSSANITHLYQNISPDVVGYLLKLNTETTHGCKDSTSQMVYTYPMVRASFNPVDPGCNPLTVTYKNTSLNAYYYTWDFDDGQKTGIENPTHLFVNSSEVDRTYKVNLRAESQYNCVDQDTVDVTVYAAPDAAFQIAPPLKLYPDAQFAFDNQTKPAADTWTYKWSLGDGQVRYGKTLPPYTYSKWGLKENGYRYEVILETSNARCQDSVHRFLYLLPAAPVAYYSSDTSATCSPLDVYFKNTSSYGDRYEWDFGDGSPISTDAEPFHSFTKPGYYNVKLSVYGDGGVAYKYKTYRVFQSPIADFKINSKELLLPEADAHFFNASQFASRYLWDFDDGGGSSTDVNPTYRYSKLGEYNVKLTAWTSLENGNCVDDTTIAAAVRVTGQGKLAYPNAFTPSVLGPNGGVYDDVDYQNQVFHPVWEGVTEYTLRIFNRWGEQIFESKDVKIGWDGYYKGKLCDPDVYVWKAEGRYTNGKSFSKLGDVTLIR